MAWMIWRIELSSPPGVSSLQHHQRRAGLGRALQAALDVVGAGRADGVLHRQHLRRSLRRALGARQPHHGKHCRGGDEADPRCVLHLPST